LSEWRARRAWSALGRSVETRRLAQMAAACGAATLATAGALDGAARMRALLDKLVAAELGNRVWHGKDGGR
jgi:hypothetical protein